MRIAWQYTWICLCLLFGMASMAYGQTVVKVAAVQIPKVSESPTKGVFIDLLKSIEEYSDLKFEISVYPGKRAHSLFDRGEVDLVIPFPKERLDGRGLISDTIFVKRDYIFVRKGSSIPKALPDFKGLVLGVNNQYRYNPDLYEQAGIQLEAGQSDEINIQKLAAGRIDGLLIEEHSAQEAIRKVGASGIVYDKAFPIFTSEIVILIKPDETGLTYKKAINEALKSMREDESYSTILNLDNGL